jgi:hypothetical protein
MHYEQIVRGQIAAERIERIADACVRAQAGRRDRRRLLLGKVRVPAERPSGAASPGLRA